MKTFGSLFSGGGGADIGAMDAGLRLAWGFEIDPQIAEVANHNLGGHVRVADILDCDPRDCDQVDVLHASPPCPNFSIAKPDGAETAHDIALASKTAEFVDVLRPRVFTLENVWGYRKSGSWALIRERLHECGYWLHIAHVNAADYGVPQARRRMIVRAVRGGFVPYLPPKVDRHVGWYEAIVDLIDEFPLCELAQWQLAKMPKEIFGDVLVPGCNPSHDRIMWQANQPAFTITAGIGGKAPARIVLLGSNASSRGNDSRNIVNHAWGNIPSMTIAATNAPLLKTASYDDVRTVSMRAVARLQTLPDWYELPKTKALAGRIIGNAVPPLLYQRIIEGLI